MQDYENLSPPAQIVLKRKDPLEKGPVSRFFAYLRSLITPIVLGAIVATFLFIYLPLLIHFHLGGTEWRDASLYAFNDMSSRLNMLMHWDFTRYQDWGFPLMGSAIAVCLKLLYEQE